MGKFYVKGNKPIFNKKKVIGILLILFGVSFFGYFLFPLFSYQIYYSSYAGGNFEVPIPKHMVARHDNITSLIAQGIDSLTHDYTDARNWYPSVTSEIKSKVNVDTYTLTIPKLKIDNAEVSTVDYDLDKHLIQYLGSSIPGEDGTAVIFGHSTLPQLFNPKNYKTIFAQAHNLKIGDEFYATVNGTRYKYKIFSIAITSPDDTNILSQGYDNSYITLVTCTPPGTIWKRLVIRAVLESSSQS